jgi:hypothetical protein
MRAALLLMLVLGALLRPMLLVACEQHAAVFAHAAQPHEHVHDDAIDLEDGAGDEAAGRHGDHQQGQSGAAAGAADVPPSLALSMPPLARNLLPRAHAARLVERAVGAPFRPPIG